MGAQRYQYESRILKYFVISDYLLLQSPYVHEFSNILALAFFKQLKDIEINFLTFHHKYISNDLDIA